MPLKELTLNADGNGISINVTISDYVIEIVNMKRGEEVLGIEEGTLVIDAIELLLFDKPVGKTEFQAISVSDLRASSVAPMLDGIEEAIIEWEWENGDWNFAEIAEGQAGDRAYHAQF